MACARHGPEGLVGQGPAPFQQAHGAHNQQGQDKVYQARQSEELHRQVGAGNEGARHAGEVEQRDGVLARALPFKSRITSLP